MVAVQKDTFRSLLPYLSAATATFVVLSLITGLLLSANFVPSTEAYTTTKMITQTLYFGWLIRGLHWWSSSLALVTSMLFTSLAYWFGAYDVKARWLWWSSLLLGLTLLGGNVTGYYLPLDQNSYWRLLIESQLFNGIPVLGPIVKNFLLAGSDFSQITVARINWLHTLVVPVFLLVAAASHLYAVKKYREL